MEFNTKIALPETFKADCIAVGVFEEGVLTASARRIDGITRGPDTAMSPASAEAALRAAVKYGWVLAFAQQSAQGPIALCVDTGTARTTALEHRFLVSEISRRNLDVRLLALCKPGELEPYDLFFVTAAYKEIGILNSARGVSHDLIVQGWDRAIFGGQPSFDWVRAWPWPWLSWVLVSAYLSYYFIVAGAPLGLWLSGPSGSHSGLYS